MSIFEQKASKGVATYLIPAGLHPAVLVGLIDLGTHDVTYKGKREEQRHILFVFEIVGGKAKGELIHRRFNLSFGPKSSLRQFLGDWRGKAIAEGENVVFTNALGKRATITVKHTQSGENTYHNLDSITKPEPSMPWGAPKHQPVAWEIEGQDTIPDFDWVPWVYGSSVEELIRSSSEWKARNKSKGMFPTGNENYQAGQQPEDQGGGGLEEDSEQGQPGVEEDIPF
jgi:hypothetical protein